MRVCPSSARHTLVSSPSSHMYFPDSALVSCRTLEGAARERWREDVRHTTTHAKWFGCAGRHAREAMSSLGSGRRGGKGSLHVLFADVLLLFLVACLSLWVCGRVPPPLPLHCPRALPSASPHA